MKSPTVLQTDDKTATISPNGMQYIRNSIQVRTYISSPAIKILPALKEIFFYIG